MTSVDHDFTFIIYLEGDQQSDLINDWHNLSAFVRPMKDLKADIPR